MSSKSNERSRRLLEAISRPQNSVGRGDFESVVELAEQLLSVRIAGGICGESSQSIFLVTHIYGASVGVRYPLQKGERSGISTACAWALVAASDNDPIAFDLAVKIAAHDFSLGSRCKKPLAQFAARLLNNEISRPQQRGPSPAENWARDFWICHTVEELQETFEGAFFATRNDASAATSYCDAVVRALENLGKHMSYENVKVIWRKGKQRGGAKNFLRDIAYIGRAAEGSPFLFNWHVGNK